MILTGIGDEAASRLEGQIEATAELGWQRLELRNIEVEGFPKANFHDLSDDAFEQVVRQLETSRVSAYCLGSTIMNWSRTVGDPFEATLAEVKRSIPRMVRLGTRYVRIMSFKPGDEEYRIPAEVFRRVKEVTNRFLDAGLQPLHENCMNYGGMSWQHGFDLLDKCPGLKWLFDTANPLCNPDRSKPKPWPKQDPWEFWHQIREHVLHIHVKDAIWNIARNGADYHWPGEGQGRVRDILQDALTRDYSGACSIEPHMAVVSHEDREASDQPALRRNYVEYGLRLGALLTQLKPL